MSPDERAPIVAEILELFANRKCTVDDIRLILKDVEFEVAYNAVLPPKKLS